MLIASGSWKREAGKYVARADESHFLWWHFNSGDRIQCTQQQRAVWSDDETGELNATDLLKLFPEPRGKRQSETMQQLRQLHIVFPVVPGQIRMCLKRGEGGLRTVARIKVWTGRKENTENMRDFQMGVSVMDDGKTTKTFLKLFLCNVYFLMTSNYSWETISVSVNRTV